ncbi:hypothetical protein ASPTUDRAFT_409564 [Aspergillus tubingensis CBS 134.48]|uniref:Uncharacterized protein n=1 Tax=Aspergillus tubingensis (strain CBS 134.48) TaxID=767770 RepID=A0A1L9NGD7_ASPTC|nr:hypothetical protein ASPTUDRAFT_409564 [Aspergillus tubingensis CBS 134.48]
MSDHSKKLELTTNNSPLPPFHPLAAVIPVVLLSLPKPFPDSLLPCRYPVHAQDPESNARQGTMDYWCAPRLGPSMPYGSFGNLTMSHTSRHSSNQRVIPPWPVVYHPVTSVTGSGSRFTLSSIAQGY